jgi:hypothetical protein
MFLHDLTPTPCLGVKWMKGKLSKGIATKGLQCQEYQEIDWDDD